MSDSILPADPSRRNAVLTSCTVGAVGGAAVAWPFLKSLRPSERALAAGAPVEVDISGLAPGQLLRVEWRGKPVWVLRRTPEMLASLPSVEPKLADPDSQRTGYPTPPYAQNEARSIKPEYLVVVGICTHLGCSPTAYFQTGAQPGLPTGWPGGWLCACHGSTFDLAGRVFANKPAPDNLEIPPYVFSADGTKVTIGVEEDNKA